MKRTKSIRFVLKIVESSNVIWRLSNKEDSLPSAIIQKTFELSPPKILDPLKATLKRMDHAL